MKDVEKIAESVARQAVSLGDTENRELRKDIIYTSKLAAKDIARAASKEATMMAQDFSERRIRDEYPEDLVPEMEATYYMYCLNEVVNLLTSAAKRGRM